MEYTYQKGLKISKMSLGTVQLGLDYGINNENGMPEEKASHEILKTAIDGGINVIDTASDYGRSETVIGDFLMSNTGHKPTIVTKFTINKNADKLKEFSEVEGILRQQVKNSLQVMHLNKLPILMLHRENEMFDYGDILPNALKKLKAEGLVERIGVSLNSNKYIDYIANSDLYEAVQIPLNMMDTSVIKNDLLRKVK